MSKPRGQFTASCGAPPVGPKDAGEAWGPIAEGPAGWDLRLLAAHFDTLMARRAEIAGFGPWRAIPLGGCGCWVAYTAGGDFRLGGLLDAWAAGRLTVPGPAEGGRACIFAASGSPVAGTGGTYALSPGDARVRRVGGPIDHLRDALDACGGPDDATGWNLAQLLAAWGVALAPVEIRDAERVLGHYRYAEGALTNAAGVVVAQLRFPGPGEPELDLDRALAIDARHVTPGVAGLTTRRRRRPGRRIEFSGPLPDPAVAAVARWLTEARLL